MECEVKFLDNPKEFYEPGQKLKAEVTLIATKSEKINRISCQIFGYAKCEWADETTATTAPGTNMNRGRVDYIKEYFCLEGDPTGDDGQVELVAKEYKYIVSYALGSELPTSFKSRNGSIKYKLRVTVDRSWKMNSKFEFPFTVIAPLNLNSGGMELKKPFKSELSKNFKLDFTTDPLFLKASIPFTGYVPGQTINVSVEVNNQSRTNVKEVRISLKKVIRLSSLKPRKKTKELIVSEAKIFTDSVSVSTLQSFEKKLIVPSLPPNILNCDVIQVQYELRVKAKTSGLSRSPKLKIPIVIGTIPLDNLTTRPSCSSLLPPSYEQALLEGASPSGDSSDGDNNFNPRYPVFEFEDGEAS